MSPTIAQEQAKSKPKLSDYITTHLNSELQQDVLAFLDYCKSAKVTYPWGSLNTWTLKARGRTYGGICIDGENDWAIWLHLTELFQYDDFLIQEGLQDAVKNSLKQCTGCSPYCTPGYADIILGEEHRHLCRGMFYVDRNIHSIEFKNPDHASTEKIKRIINFKLAIPHGTPARPVCDPAASAYRRIDNACRVSDVTDMQGNSFKAAPNMSVSYLFDGEYSTYARFFSKDDCFNIIFRLDEPAELAMYGLVTASQLLVPDSWKLYGASARDGEWTLLDARDAFPKPVTSYTEWAFAIGSPQPFMWYRLSFDVCKFDLSQVHLYTK